MKRALVCKLDVEEHELHLMNGGYEMFMKMPCCMIKSEIQITNQINPVSYFKLVREFGYDIYLHAEEYGYGGSGKHEPYDKDGSEIKSMTDVYLVQKDWEGCVRRVLQGY